MGKSKSHNSMLPSKIAATLIGSLLVAVETGLNAEHVAGTEGWYSMLTLGVIGATLASAAAIPIAERAALHGARLKAAGLMTFFMLMLAFSFTTSLSRIGSKQDGDAATVMHSNKRAVLAEAAYQQAIASQAAECATGRKTLCRKAEKAVSEARVSLATAPVQQNESPMAIRIAAVTGLSQENVSLYTPLLLPFGLTLGGFFFLAYGLGPMREPLKKTVPKPHPSLMRNAPPVQPVKITAPTPLIEFQGQPLELPPVRKARKKRMLP